MCLPDDVPVYVALPPLFGLQDRLGCICALEVRGLVWPVEDNGYQPPGYGNDKDYDQINKESGYPSLKSCIYRLDGLARI